MTPVRVIGMGSPHGTDNAGWMAIDALRDNGLVSRYPCGTLSMENCRVPAQLYQLVEGCRLAIVLDAVTAKAGSLLYFSAREIRNSTDQLSVHGVGVGEMLALIDALTDHPPRVVLVGIGVTGPRVSETGGGGSALLDRLQGMIEKHVGAYLREHTLPVS